MTFGWLAATVGPLGAATFFFHWERSAFNSGAAGFGSLFPRYQKPTANTRMLSRTIKTKCRVFIIVMLAQRRQIPTAKPACEKGHHFGNPRLKRTSRRNGHRTTS